MTASPAETTDLARAPATGSPSLEQQLLRALQDAQRALAGAEIKMAADLMKRASTLCELALREPASLSRDGLAEIQRLFAACLQGGRPLQDAIAQRMAESGAVAKAAKAYRPPRRRP